MPKLDEIEKIAKLDGQGMLGRVRDLPQMLSEAAGRFSLTGDINGHRSYAHIVICGMGGSAIGGDICRALLPLPIRVNRNYFLPAYVTDQSLLFLVSYSGETEETLASFKEGLARGCRMICISSGGKLLQLAQESQIPYVQVQGGLQPRAAIAYLSVPLLLCFEKLELAYGISAVLKETLSVLEKQKESFEVEIKSKLNPAKILAEKLAGKILLILSSEGLTAAAGLRWKTQFNENSKVTAHLAIFPELDHNEIVNLAELKKGQHPFALIILRDTKENDRVVKRIEITKSLIAKGFSGMHEIWASGESALARIFSLIYLGDFVSVYLAILNDKDPTPVEVIQKLKRELKR